jgi:hypothetical protein
MGERISEGLAMVQRNMDGNRQRDSEARQDRERVTRERGPQAAADYLSGRAARPDVDNASSRSFTMQRAAAVAAAGGAPQRRVERSSPLAARGDLRAAIDMATDNRVSDARARNAAVSEQQPYGNGAELTRGQGPGRRGVLQRPFTVRVDGQNIPISDSQRVTLRDYVNENPRAFDTFADWYNAISTLDGATPDQLSVEGVAMARRQWSAGSQGRPGFAPADAEYTLDPAYVRGRGPVNEGADYPYRNVDQGVNADGQPVIVGQRLGAPVDRSSGRRVTEDSRFSFEEAPEWARQQITPAERETATFELRQIIERNLAERNQGRSRTVAARDATPGQPSNVLDIPRRIAEAVIARARITDEARNLREEAANRPTRPERRNDKPGNSKQTIAGGRGTLMTSRDVAAQQQEDDARRNRADGIDLGDGGEQRDLFTGERILPIRPRGEGSAESESELARRLRRAGTVGVGSAEVGVSDRGVGARIRY